jgi:hypothetical protein
VVKQRARKNLNDVEKCTRRISSFNIIHNDHCTSLSIREVKLLAIFILSAFSKKTSLKNVKNIVRSLEKADINHNTKKSSINNAIKSVREEHLKA